MISFYSHKGSAEILFHFLSILGIGSLRRVSIFWLVLQEKRCMGSWGIIGWGEGQLGEMPVGGL